VVDPDDRPLEPKPPRDVLRPVLPIERLPDRDEPAPLPRDADDPLRYIGPNQIARPPDRCSCAVAGAHSCSLPQSATQSSFDA